MSRNKEYFPTRELDPRLADAYARSFIHRRDCYPIQLKDGKYITIKGALTSDLIAAHIEGRFVLLAYNRWAYRFFTPATAIGISRLNARPTEVPQASRPQ